MKKIKYTKKEVMNTLGEIIKESPLKETSSDLNDPTGEKWMKRNPDVVKKLKKDFKKIFKGI